LAGCHCSAPRWNDIGGSEASGSAAAAVLTVPTLLSKAEADAAMRVVLEDYGHYATGRKPREGEDALLVLDQFSALASGVDSAINLAERVRDVGVQVVVAAQSVEGLGDHRQAPRVLAACAGGIVVQQCPDPERLLALAGQERVLEHNWDLDFYGPRGLAKARMGERPRIDPEAVRQAQPGEAWVIQAGQSVHLRVCPRRPASAPGRRSPPQEPRACFAPTASRAAESTADRTERLLAAVRVALVAALTALVLAIAALAYVVSFEAIRAFAIETAAFPPSLAWSAPLLVDSFTTAASLVILWRYLRGEGWREPWYAWILVGCATGVSAALNVAHAPDRTSAQLFAALPPVALLGALELLMSVARTGLPHRDRTTSAQDGSGDRGRVAIVAAEDGRLAARP
jgi:hypothetical protein